MKNLDSPSLLAVTLVLLALSTLSACTEAVDSGGAATAGQPVPQVAAIDTASKLPARNSGTVISNQRVGGYSYLEVDIDGDAFWLATSISAAKAGDRIVWRDYAVMRNFKSTTLNREFPQILFIDRVEVGTEVARQAHRGTVLESMNSAGYSYIRVEEDGVDRWLAAPETQIEVGQSILWSDGSPMRNFTSRSLDRVFDEILFVGAVQGS